MTERREPLLELENVSRSFPQANGELPVLRNVSFSLYPGEVLSLVGPSGCGKTTLLNLIAGLDKDHEGTIELNNTASNGKQRALGYIFQEDALLPWRNAIRNALLGAEVNGGVEEKHIKLAGELMQRFSLAGFEKHYPSQLSGGMRQRLAIIQTLVLDPRLLLLDEPFSAVDYYNKLTLEDTLYRFLKEKNKAAILVTHDLEEAVALSDRILLFSARPARIIREIAVDFGVARSQLPPSAARGAERFSHFYNMIWQELKDTIES